MCMTDFNTMPQCTCTFTWHVRIKANWIQRLHSAIKDKDNTTYQGQGQHYLSRTRKTLEFWPTGSPDAISWPVTGREKQTNSSTNRWEKNMNRNGTQMQCKTAPKHSYLIHSWTTSMLQKNVWQPVYSPGVRTREQASTTYDDELADSYYYVGQHGK